MKKCRSCKRDLPETEFGRYARAKDGLRPDCRACRRKQSAAYYEQNKPSINERNRARYAANPEPWKAGKRAYYAKNREKVIAAEAAYKRTPRGREVGRASYRRQRERDNRPFLARLHVARALKKGVLKKQPCACGATRVEAHHHRGYSKEHELDVVWLCKACHDTEHGKQPSRGDS